MLELEPLFRAVIHGTRAGLFDESFQLYFERIKRGQFSIFTEGSHHADQSCIRAFFKKPWSEPVAQLSEEASFYLLSCASTNLIYLGQIDEAISPSIQSIQWFQKSGRWIEAAATSGPLVSMLIAAGRLRDARREWNRVQSSIANAGNVVLAAVATSIGAYLSHLEGDSEAARRAFVDAESVLKSESVSCDIVCPTVSAYYCKYLLDSGEIEEALQRSLQTMQWRKERSWQVAVDTTSLYASDLLFLGMAYLALGDLESASANLDKQVKILKSANEWLYLPSGLIARAQFLIASGELSAAYEDLIEALEIAKKTGAKYSEGEAYLALAAAALSSRDLAAARSYFNSAQRMESMLSFKNYRDALVALEEQLTALSNSVDSGPG